eukprot:g520.t1
MGLLKQLQEFDKDNIPKSVIKALGKYVVEETMQKEYVKRQSVAAHGLCLWAHAMYMYDKVAKTVGPKKAKVAEMKAELQGALDALEEKRSALQKIIDKVDALKRQLQEAQDEKARILANQKQTADRLSRASILTVGLADEQVRWAADVANYEKLIKNVPGDVFIASSCISYFGAFTGSYRKKMVDYWSKATVDREVPITEGADLNETLGIPVEIKGWQIQGLPSDEVSRENGILVKIADRWPLMIDPQEQAKGWIKNMQRDNNLQVTRMGSVRMLQALESTIRLGAPLLIEDIGELLDPALEPVLAKAIFEDAGRKLIRLGDSDVPYNDEFKLYITTKLPNPHYLPEVCIKVTIINFTVTLQGLEDQLLGDVVKKERPDVEERMDKLVSQMAKDEEMLAILVDKILSLLSNASGNILDDDVLITTIDDSKKTSISINQRMEEAKVTNEEISNLRNQYRPVATRGSLIYFVVADLAKVDPMYQYSLQYFKGLYNKSIDLAKPSEDLSTRLDFLEECETETIFLNICRGLFEKDKLMFSFLITISILKNRGDMSEAEWSLLLRGAGLVVNEKPNPLPELIPEGGWNLLARMEQDIPDVFGDLTQSVLDNFDDWKAWFTSSTPETAPLPGKWAAEDIYETKDIVEGLNLQQKMLVLKCFREEKLLMAISEFVEMRLGKIFVQAPPTRMADVYADTTSTSPCVFILSQGADPTGLLISLAKQRNFLDKLQMISLGQGQGPKAVNMINSAKKAGHWVLLQNCHLARSWMPKLDKICDELRDPASTTFVHEEFRLFLTSMPATYFPVPVLQNSVKLTTEPPKGIRANLLRSYGQLNDWSTFEECDGANGVDVWKKLVFGLSTFHAVVQERRKFGPLGWNIIYEFNDSDLETSVMILKMFLQEQPTIPWQALIYVIGQISYGGRVTDDLDRRCLMCILQNYVTTNILDDAFKFDPQGIYYAPKSGNLESYIEYITDLPLSDPPALFGMHENANIAFQRKETNYTIETCLSIQPRAIGSTASGKSPDEEVDALAIEIFEKTPKVLTREEAGENTFIYRGEHMDSLATFLGQEMIRFNKLLVEMQTSLVDIRRAIRGEVLLSAVLDEMYTALLDNRVPNNWSNVGYKSLKPLASWNNDLLMRVKALREWVHNGQPKVFWLSGYYFPQGFMTGTLQNHARKYMVPIDTLGFSFTTYKRFESDEEFEATVPEDGVVISGIFLDGGKWDLENDCIREGDPGEMFSNLPIVHFMPEQNHQCPETFYECPCYKTSERAGELSTTGMSTNFVVTIELSSKGTDPNKWVLQGTGCLLNLDD